MPLTCNVEEAKTDPSEFTTKSPDESELCSCKILAICPNATRIESGIAFVEDASIVTTEFPIAFAVPKVDGEDVPLTAPASCVNALEVICLRGENV